MNDTMQCMRRHSSVRSFLDRPVAGEVLEQLIECGQAASSSSFVQAYSVLRVTRAANRQRIAAAAGHQAWVVEAPEFLVLCADLYRIEHCCLKEGQGELDGFTEHFITATVDVALMAQNMLLAAESMGLGGVFIGGIRNDPETVSDCLQLPRQVYPVFGLCLGWPADVNPPKPRMPVGHVLHQDAYDVNAVARNIEQYDGVMADYYSGRDNNSRVSNWSRQTARAVQGKKREHMLDFLRARGLLLR